MRIAIIGPTHPYKGGVSLHTTELAHLLEAIGHEVALFSWQNQYPVFLYPGEQRVAAGKPELPLFGNTTYPLNWFDPTGWLRLGRKLRNYDVVIMTYWIPQFQGSAGLAMLQAMGGRKRRARVIAICHNVLPHESKPGDKQITKLFLSRVDMVMTHSQAEAKLAHAFTNKPVRMTPLAPHLPASARSIKRHTASVQQQLLFFGMVRKYKGVDVLLRALAATPNVSLAIVGEATPKTQATLQALIEELGLSDRVSFSGTYVPAEDIPKLFATADALVLPYRSGTGSQNVDLGFSQGVPVIASNLKGISDQIKDGVNGLLCKPDDVVSLAAAIRHLYQPGVLEQLRKNLPDVAADSATAWQAYLTTLLAA